jgi:RimJ/RimL family protein N-acetyltransferase
LNKKIPTINGDRVTLRPFTEQDIPTVARLANEKTLAEGVRVLPFPYTLQDATQWIMGQQKYVEEGEGYPFAVMETHTQALAGSIEIRPDKDGSGKLGEIGYWIGKPYRRKGYAAEALMMVIDYARKNFGCETLSAYANQDNAASQAVLKKCGFTFIRGKVGEFKQDYFELPLGRGKGRDGH